MFVVTESDFDRKQHEIPGDTFTVSDGGLYISHERGGVGFADGEWRCFDYQVDAEPEPTFTDEEIAALFQAVRRASDAAGRKIRDRSCSIDCQMCASDRQPYALALAALERVYPTQDNGHSY